MSDDKSASAVCKDAYAVLNGAVEIRYRNTEVWRLEGDDGEHPLVPALRAAAMDAVINDVPADASAGIDDMQAMLAAERVANDKMRNFLNRLQTMCELGGFQGRGPEELLAWLKTKLS